MLQRGLDGSKPLMGLSFWRSGIIAAEMADGAVSLVGSERPPMECCSRPLRARDRSVFVRLLTIGGVALRAVCEL